MDFYTSFAGYYWGQLLGIDVDTLFFQLFSSDTDLSESRYYPVQSLTVQGRISSRIDEIFLL